VLPGAFLIRRLLGVAHAEDMEAIADVDVRAACELRALGFGRHLLVEGAATYRCAFTQCFTGSQIFPWEPL